MIIVDLEASGTEYYKHSIVSVGALELENPKDRFYLECKMWDGAHIMPESLEITGFTKEEICDPSKKEESELVQEFLDWISTKDDHTLVGQNVSFDRDFLRAAALRAHINWPLAYRTIDTHTLCYMHMIKRGLNIPKANKRSALDLDAVLNYVGIPGEPTPHNALTGALSHAEVTNRLLYDEKLLPEFEEFSIPWKK